MTDLVGRSDLKNRHGERLHVLAEIEFGLEMFPIDSEQHLMFRQIYLQQHRRMMRLMVTGLM
jgi:hypothetical protein